MSYMHIKSLYKEQDILLFKECYALEKIHGTSAHISYKNNQLNFSSGGSKHENFIKLFNSDSLIKKFVEHNLDDITIYGEAYGGKLQKMRLTYGETLKFIAFEVKINDLWLNVPQADEIVSLLSLEFVSYAKISTDIDSIDKQLAKFSVQALRNGCGKDKIQEGIVLRPLIELRKNNGERIIVKHKNEEFRETTKKRTVTDIAKLEVIEIANKVAEEWVTRNRVIHVLDDFVGPLTMSMMGNIIKAMIIDVKRESENEVVWSIAVEKAIGKVTVRIVRPLITKVSIELDKDEQ